MPGMPGDRAPARHALARDQPQRGALFGMGQGLGMLFAPSRARRSLGSPGPGLAPGHRERPLDSPGPRADRRRHHRQSLRSARPARISTGTRRSAARAIPSMPSATGFTSRSKGVIDWPIFNLADTWLVIGAGLLAFCSFAASRRRMARTPPEPVLREGRTFDGRSEIGHAAALQRPSRRRRPRGSRRRSPPSPRGSTDAPLVR
jgi:hypothetical protein